MSYKGSIPSLEDPERGIELMSIEQKQGNKKKRRSRLGMLVFHFQFLTLYSKLDYGLPSSTQPLNLAFPLLAWHRENPR